MKLIRSLLASLALACLSVTPALAAPVFSPGAAYIPNYMVVGVVDATAGYTNATTSYTDVTGASVALPAYDGDFSKQYIEACYSADVSKATATTGTLQLIINGAAVTATRRTTTFGAGQNAIGACFVVARASGAAQTVKLQGVSGDTNVFTVSNAQMRVNIIQGL